MDARLETAVEAAARAFHENAREKRQFTWEASSEEWRRRTKTAGLQPSPVLSLIHI